jgi:hypothetical protein
MRVESCRLSGIEDERDPVYNRYAGRQIVEVDSVYETEFESGSLVLRTTGRQALRTMLLMEPLKLYGLFQYDKFRELVSDDGILPVFRLPQENEL